MKKCFIIFLLSIILISPITILAFNEYDMILITKPANICKFYKSEIVDVYTYKINTLIWEQIIGNYYMPIDLCIYPMLQGEIIEIYDNKCDIKIHDGLTITAKNFEINKREY